MWFKILQIYATLHKISCHPDFLGWINLGRLRIPGVLQRFGISYFVVASTGMIFKASFEQKKFVSIRRVLSIEIFWTYQSIHIYINNYALSIIIFQNDWRRHIVDLLSVWQRWIVAATFVIVHTAIVFGLPVPGCRTGTVFSNFVLVDEPAVIYWL